MEHLLYPIVIAALLGGFGFLLLRQRRAFEEVCEQREAIEVEEHRMFQFLHGLGESLQEDSSPPSMHRYIVNGVAEVVDADGGILYLLDNPERPELVPVYQTDRAAPVIPLPADLFELDDDRRLRRLRSYLQLTTVPRASGLLGQALKQRQTIYSRKLVEDKAFDGSPNPLQDNLATMISPLVYGQKEVGVLAVVKNGGGTFSKNDRDVFSSIAEQSSFALGSAIIHAEAHEKRRLESELKQASEIQRILLPKKPPGLSDYHLASTFRAARLVSGDYFDYVTVDENHFGIVIGDVCGKGIAASLIMAMCRSTLRNNAKNERSPAKVLAAVNRSIFPDIREDMFVSLLYLVLSRDSNQITLARAGHEPPLVYRKASGEVETIEPSGMAAGIDNGGVFERSLADFELSLDPGDQLVLYTDGVIEAVNFQGDEFGIGRLRDTIASCAGNGANALVDGVSEAVADFVGQANQSDDITLIAVEKR